MRVEPINTDPHRSTKLDDVQVSKVKQFQMNVQKDSEKPPEQQRGEDVDLSKTAESLSKIFERLIKFFKTEAQFTIERELNMIIIKIKDRDTGEIIRQIPPEVAVRIAKNLQELVGILFDEKV